MVLEASLKIRPSQKSRLPLLSLMPRQVLRYENEHLDAVAHLSNEHILLLRSAFPLADVPRDFGCSDDCALGIDDWRHSERNIDETPVLVLAHRLIVIDTLPSPQAFKEWKVLSYFLIWRYQDTYGLDDFSRVISLQQALGPLIQGDVQLILGHNRIVEQLDDRRGAASRSGRRRPRSISALRFCSSNKNRLIIELRPATSPTSRTKSK